jgi:DNA replication and repair protein RecF
MWLEKISVHGVRNLEDTEITFHPQVNYLYGKNGAGKTSILEAIYFLAVGRSFRTNRDNEIISFNAPFLKINGTAHNDSSELNQSEIRLENNIKTVFLESQKQEKLSSYLGWLPIVTILLSDIDLVSGTPQRRRSFIDLAISKISKNYLKNLIEYRQVLMQRNKLLQEKTDDAHYEVWETSLVKYGIEIYQERKRYLPALITEAQKLHSVFMPGRSILFEYKPSIDNYQNLPEHFLNLLKENRVKDKELGHTTIGPHRDDISINELSLPVRKFGSEGEQRLAALSLKMAEAELLAKNNQRPIFLLDEVAAELDTDNSRKLFELIKGQFFYATAKEFKNTINQNGKIIYVEKGKIEKTETVG